MNNEARIGNADSQPHDTESYLQSAKKSSYLLSFIDVGYR